MLKPGPPGALALDRGGGVVLDVTGADEQRRLPIDLSEAGKWIPPALIAAEDLAFPSHPGVDLSAIMGAVRDNLAAGKIVRGASTITMQVAGLRLGHPRTFPGKAVEAFRALQIEAKYSKDEILEAWLNLASFGGNIVGVETASRAWYGKPAHQCSLAEAALLVGLPNSPKRFRPDRHLDAATARKNTILSRMHEAGMVTTEQYHAALEEVVLIRRSAPLRNDTHAGWMVLGRAGGDRVMEMTLRPDAQEIAEDLVARHAKALPKELDIAIVLVDLEDSSVSAMVGSSDFSDPRDGQVNGATARRSPGSALKPFVYAAAFEARRLAPESIVDDAPLELDGWRPRNLDHGYLGEMPAAEALKLSRNTPALRIAKGLGLPRLISTLRCCGIRVPTNAAERSGLSMVVGGLEVPPLELAAAYATLARGGVFMPLRLLEKDPLLSRRVLSRDTCTAIEECLAGPANEFSEAMPFIAAKTGTSSGHRDAIAAGWNRSYAAVVWVGRFDGGSDPYLMGAEAALPILQELLRHPSLLTVRTPRERTMWAVHRQVGRSTPRLPAILEPRDGDVLCAVLDEVHITPKLRTAGSGAILFLNGAPVRDARLRLGPGKHELRLVEIGREPHAITVEVIDAVHSATTISGPTKGAT
jgi:penicillin-binding protein 1C